MYKNIVNFHGQKDIAKDFIEFLRGKSASFLLSLSTTKTCEIPNITQAGIEGKIHLTPILDAEFLCSGEVRSIGDIAKTAKGVPTPALITRAVHLLKPFNNIELLNLGLTHSPKINFFKIYDFKLKPSERIDLGANIDAESLFEIGVEFGKNYKSESDYIILGESVPSGTTTAYATAKALGYDCDGMFSSSFKAHPKSLKNEVINKALSNISVNMDIFEKLSKVSDNMLIFNAGFVIALMQNYKVILAGGTQMASLLLVMNSIIEVMQGQVDGKNLALVTTKWLYEDENSDIKGLLELLSFDVLAYYSDFDFSQSESEILKLYDKGEAKEGVGAGGAIFYGYLNNLTKEQITRGVEGFFK